MATRTLVDTVMLPIISPNRKGASPSASAATNTTAIQEAIDEAVAARAATIVLGPGQYDHNALTQAPASLQTHINWLGLGGAGSNGVVLNYVGTGGTALTIKNNTRYCMENLRFKDGGTGALGMFLSSLTTGSNHGPAKLRNVVLDGFTTGVQIGDTSNQAASELTFENLEISNSTLGMLIQGPVSGTSFSSNIRLKSFQASFCATILRTAGDNTIGNNQVFVEGFSFSECDLGFDFQVPGNYSISRGVSEHAGAGQFIKSGSSTPTANSASVTHVGIDQTFLNHASSPSNFIALFNQPGHYTVKGSVLQTGSIQLGGYDGGAGGRKSALTVEQSTIVSASARIAYRAGSNTVWLVRHLQSGIAAVEAINADDDRVYLIKTTGAEHNFGTPIPWSSSVATLDAL